MYRKFLVNFFIYYLLLLYCYAPCSSCKGQTKDSVSDKGVHKEFSSSTDKVVDRYLNILLATPRYGTVFDRVYYHYAENNAITGLLKRIGDFPQTENVENRANRLFLQGLVYVRQNDLDHAIDQFREADRLLPNQVPIIVMRAKTLILQGFLQEGAEILENLLLLNISEPESEKIALLELLGETWLRLNKPEKAEAVWKNIIDDSSVNPDTLYRLAGIRENMGQYREALALYEKMERIAHDKKDRESEMKYALSAVDMKIRLGEKKEGIEICERLRDEVSGDNWLSSQLLDRIEHLFLQQSDYSALLEYYRTREKNHPNDIDCIWRQALVLYSLSRMEDAKNLLENGLKKAPSNVILRKTLAELETEQNHFENAARLYAEIDSLEPNNPDTLTAWGNCVFQNIALDEQTRIKKAVEIWKRLLNNRPDNRATILLVTDIMLEKGLYSEVEPLLRRLIELFPDDPGSYQHLVDLHFLNHNEKEAFDVLNQMTSDGQKKEEMFIGKAKCLRTHQYLHEAALAVRQALELHPHKFESERLLLEILLENCEYTDIDSTFTEAESTAKSDNEKNILFSLRLRYLYTINNIGSLFDELDKILKGASGKDPDVLAESYWKKVTALLYIEDTESAIEVAISALKNKAVSSILLQKGMEAVDKSPIPEKSLQLLTLLSEVHPAERVGYLKSIASIQMELGQVTEAIATGKRILDENSKKVSNHIIYADILLACGRTDEAIDILRRAIRFDSNDQTTLIKLAELLDNSGKTNDAIDLQWKVFKRASRMEDKLQIIDVLAKYYKNIDKFDLFKEQLNSNGKNAVARRENTYCLARAYTAIQDYSSARKTLESLLSFSEKGNQDEEFLLSHLSGLAEMQNDLSSAIEYQEKLCVKNNSPIEKERLLALYHQSGNKNKARLYLLKKILPGEPFHKQLETIDTLLALEEYDTAHDILDALENKYPDNWELTARRMMIAGWTGQKELSALVMKIQKCPLTSDTRSTQIPGKVGLPKFSPISPGTTAWHIGNIHDLVLEETNSPEAMESLATKLVLTIYRERLTLNEQIIRSGIVTSVKQQKPILSFPSLLSAQMAAEAWGMKMGFATVSTISDRDLPDISQNKNIDGPTVSLLLKTYIFEQYKKRLVENGILKEKNHQDLSDRIIIVFAGVGYKEWYRTAFPLLLKLLKNEKDKKGQLKLTNDLLNILESSFIQRTLEKDRDVWVLSANFAEYLEIKGFKEQAVHVRTLRNRALKQDYSLFLPTQKEVSNIPFDLFVQSIRNARKEAVIQSRNQNDIERVYQIFGEALSSQLNREYYTAFQNIRPDIFNRITQAQEIWKTLSAKTSFGPKVLQVFIRLNKNTLFCNLSIAIKDVSLNKEQIDEAQKAINMYKTAAERLYSLALETDKELTDAFSSHKFVNSVKSGGMTVSELCRFLGRDRSLYNNLAAYLINKAMFEKSDIHSTIVDSNLLESIYGTCFMVDMLCVSSLNTSNEDNIFLHSNTIDLHLGQLEKNIIGQNGSFSRRKIHTILSILKKQYLGIAPSEDLYALEYSAKESLLRNAPDAPVNTVLYVGLTMLALIDNREKDAIILLDKIKGVRFTDIKMKEFCILNALSEYTGQEAVSRKNTAINRLAGYRLDEDESIIFRSALIREKHSGEAEKIYKRLLLSVTKEKNINVLLDEVLTRHKNIESFTEEEIVFALKIFHRPLWNFGTVKEVGEIRTKAINILASAGKLDEVRTQLERQIPAAPGSFDLFMQLAEVYFEQGRKKQLEEIVSLAEKFLPNDPIQMINYAKILSQANENKKANEHLKKAFTIKPDLFFSEREKFTGWDSKCDLDYLTSIEQERLVPYIWKVFTILLKTMENEVFKEKAFDIVNRIWNGGSLGPESRQIVQSSVVRLLCESKNERFFPIVKEWFLEAIGNRNSTETSVMKYQDIHRLIQWDNTHPKTLSLSFLELTANYNKLNDLLTEVRNINEFYHSHDKESPIPASAAAVLEIQILIRLNQMDQAVTRLSELKNESYFCTEGIKYDALALVTAFGDKSDLYAEQLIPYFEKAYKENPHPVYEKFFEDNISRLKLHMFNKK